jgi:hypothetical protein
MTSGDEDYYDDSDFHRDRQYVSQWSSDSLSLSIMRLGVPGDVDDDDDHDIWVDVIREDDSAVIFHRQPSHSSTGLYETNLSSQESSSPGYYTVVWRYFIDGVEQEYHSYIEIGESSPDYDHLHSEMKHIVDTVWVRFADLYDSPGGGPNLMTYFQTHFNRGRLAQLLRIAIGTLNTVAQPHSTYTLDDHHDISQGGHGATFPFRVWGPLLERSLFVEALKHLIRSYVEQPMFVGGAVTRLDRRDYIDRWNIVLSQEEPVFQRQMEVFKIAHMGMGKPAVLVAGGIYGRRGIVRTGAASMAARPHMWARWY